MNMHILVVDDHQLFLDGIRHLLEKLEPGTTITEANTVESALDALDHSSQFDLALIDLCMPGMDGLALLQSMNNRRIRLPVVIVSGEEELAKIKAAMDMGALGFIPKRYSSQQMRSALSQVLEGDIYLPEHLESQLDRLASRREPRTAEHNPAVKESGITRRQYEVLKLLAQGLSNKQIANTLFLTEHTVKSHVSALFVLLSANNRTACVQNAERRGLLSN